MASSSRAKQVVERLYRAGVLKSGLDRDEIEAAVVEALEEPTDVRHMTCLGHNKNNYINLIEEIEGDHTIWLDTPVAECDGICIGIGATVDKAKDDAAKTLFEAFQLLRPGAVLIV